MLAQERRRGQGLEIADPKGLPLYHRAKIGKPNRLQGLLALVSSRRLGLLIFPSAVSQGVSGRLVLGLIDRPGGLIALAD